VVYATEKNRENARLHAHPKDDDFAARRITDEYEAMIVAWLLEDMLGDLEYAVVGPALKL
jgi:hypothetical protein